MWRPETLSRMSISCLSPAHQFAGLSAASAASSNYLYIPKQCYVFISIRRAFRSEAYCDLTQTSCMTAGDSGEMGSNTELSRWKSEALTAPLGSRTGGLMWVLIKITHTRTYSKRNEGQRDYTKWQEDKRNYTKRHEGYWNYTNIYEIHENIRGKNVAV